MQEQKNHPPLQILQVLPALQSGGVERGTIDLASFLQKKGHTPFVASKGGDLCRILEEKKIKHFSFDLASKNPLVILKNAFRLKSIIKANKIDLIHARSRAPAWSAYLASKITNIPFVTTFHGTYNFQKTFLGLLKKAYNSVMARGEAVIAISQFIQDHISAHYLKNLKPNALSLINRGVDLKEFNRATVSQDHIQSLKKQWSLTTEHKIILVPGRLTRWKGQGIVLRALENLISQNPYLVCVFIGSDQGRHAYTQELKEQVRKALLENNVRFMDHVDDMPAAYCMGDLVVHASTDPEAFGRVIIEAQAMEVPIIASNLGAPAQTIEQGKTGWLHKAGDAEDLAAKIRHVLETDCSPFTKKALDHVQENYSDQLMFEKTIAAYERVLKRDC
ncbi:MAG TPA: glycosyl transferase [Holosporales bacterium]|nr:glycosyl transferase [Holosporales bacterium]